MRASSWLDAEHGGVAWDDQDLTALFGPSEFDTMFDMRAGLAMARTVLDESITADAAPCGSTRYVMVTLTRRTPAPSCRRDITDENPSFPDNIDHVCDDATYQACVRAAGVCDSGQLCDDSRGLTCTTGAACAEPTCAPDPGNNGSNVCTSADGETSCFASSFVADAFGGIRNSELVPNGDYNQIEQLQSKATAIAELFNATPHVQLDALFVVNTDAPAEVMLPAFDAVSAVLGGTAEVVSGPIDWQARGFTDSGFVRPAP